MINILECSIDEIKQILKENDIKEYIANQIFDFIHNKLIFDFDQFYNIKKETREN